MYKLIQNSDSVLRVEDGAEIPADARNRHRAEYAAWLEAGGVPIPADQPSHNEQIDAQIRALEAAKPGYVRGIREFMLGVADGLTVVSQTLATQLKSTPGMVNVKTLDDQIKALRAQRLP